MTITYKDMVPDGRMDSLFGFVFVIPPTAKVIWMGTGLEKQGTKPAIPGLQGVWFIHNTTSASKKKGQNGQTMSKLYPSNNVVV